MNIVEQITEEIKKELPNKDIEEIAGYLANFNTLFVKTAMSRNPVYRESLYNMLENMRQKLTHWKISPFIVHVLYKSYILILENEYSAN